MKKTIFIIIILSSVSLFSESDFFSMYLDSMETAYNAEKHAQVEKFFNILTNYDSERYEPYYYFASTLYKLGKTKDALPLIGRATELNQSEETYFLYCKMLLGYDDKLFVQTVNTALSAHPVSVNLNVLKLDYYNSKNMPDSAYTYALFVYNKNPNDRGALYALAKYEAGKENYTLANTYLTKLLSLKEPRNEDYLLAGRVYSNSKNYAAANKAYFRLISSPYRYYSLNRLSDNYFTLQFFDSSMMMLDSLKMHYPDSSAVYQKMLALFAKTKNESMLDSVYSYSFSAGIADSSFLDNLAGQLFKYDRYDKALSAYKMLSQKNTGYSNKEYVQACFFLKDYASSKRVLDIFPLKTLQDTLFNLKYNGLIFFRMNKGDSAEIYFERAYLLSDKDTILIKNLANTYYANQKMVKLGELLESVKSAYPALSDSLNAKYFKKE